jgi:hypothetical protein
MRDGTFAAVTSAKLLDFGRPQVLGVLQAFYIEANTLGPLDGYTDYA